MLTLYKNVSNGDDISCFIIYYKVLMSDIKERNIPGSRVYHIDRECYVLYMGKPERMYRPFLRVGNSPQLPADIQQYIGSVILSDRLTGNCFIEDLCLKGASSPPTNYVGTRELINAITNFVGKKKISEHPLSSESKKDSERGGNVVFYVNGNFKILLNGHCLLDLFKREKDDHHHITTIQRIEEYVNKAEGSLTSDDLHGNGFILLRNNSFALFQNGVIQSCGIEQDSLVNMTETMIPPSLFRRFGGTSDKASILNLSKWHATQGNSIEFILNEGSKGEVQKFFKFLKQAGVKISLAEQLPIPEYLDIASYTALLKLTETSSPVSIKGIKLPGKDSWMLNSLPILPAVPYVFPDTSKISKFDFHHAQNTLEEFMGTAGKEFTGSFIESSDRQAALNSLGDDQKFDDAVRLTIFIWLWNHLHSNADDTSKNAAAQAQFIGQQIVTLQNTVLLPMKAELAHLKGGWAVLFSMKQGTSRQVLRSWKETREKIATLAHFVPDEAFFESERKRLINALRILLEQDVLEDDEVEDSVDESTLPSGSREAETTQTDEPPAGKLKAAQQKPRKKKLLIPVIALASLLLLALLLALLIPRGAGVSEPVADDTLAEKSEVQEIQKTVDNDTEEPQSVYTIEWNLAEVLFITNWISYNNGYDLVGEETILERDPNWIYPGNVFILPDRSSYEVLRGETLWFIASDFLDRMFEKSGMNEEDFHAFIENMEYNQDMLFENN